MRSLVQTAKRWWHHYSATGQAAHYVLRDYYEHLGEKHENYIRFRKGRIDHGEAVQIEIDLSIVYPKTRRSQYATISIDPETWAAIVEHVREDQEISIATAKQEAKAGRS